MQKTTAAPGTFTRSADDRLVSIATAADYLGVTQRTVRNMLLDGRLPAYTLGPRILRIRLSDIEAALAPYGGADAT
jgi:excisionase family DNA binding protein